MNQESIENLLKAISLQSLKTLTGATLEPAVVHAKIEHFAFLRPTLGALQILDLSSDEPEYSYVMKFGFAANFMYENRSTDSFIYLPYLIWLLKIPEYKFGSQINGAIGEELSTWLSRCQIEICKSPYSDYEYPVDELQNLFLKIKN